MVVVVVVVMMVGIAVRERSEDIFRVNMLAASTSTALSDVITRPVALERDLLSQRDRRVKLAQDVHLIRGSVGASAIFLTIRRRIQKRKKCVWVASDCFFFRLFAATLRSMNVVGIMHLPSDSVQPVSYTHLTLPTNREV